MPGNVRDTFRPAGLAIVIIDNDYDQSLAKYGFQRGKHQFVERGGGRLALERSDLEFRLRYRLVRGSALARYVAINLGMARERIHRLFTGEDPDARVPEADRATWVVDSKRAVDAFLDMLPAASGLEPERIMFIVDGIRPRVYGSDVPEWEKGVYREDVGYVDAMRRYFIEKRCPQGIRDHRPGAGVRRALPAAPNAIRLAAARRALERTGTRGVLGGSGRFGAAAGLPAACWRRRAGRHMTG